MNLAARRHMVFRSLLMQIGAVPKFDYEPNFNCKIKADAERRMSNIDDMPAALRAVIQECGYHAVHSFLNYGITDPKAIRFLIYAARGIQPEQGTFIKENHRPYKLHRIEGKR